MIFCPVCGKMENFSSPVELRRHLIAQLANGVQFSFPLICRDALCSGWGSYSTIDNYIAHVKKFHTFSNEANGQSSGETAFPSQPNNCYNVYDEQNVCSSQLETNSEQNDFENEVLQLLLTMYSNSSVPHSCVSGVIQSFEKYVGLLRRNVLDALNSCGEEIILSHSVVEKVFEKAEHALHKVNTSFKAKNSLFTHPLFVNPEPIPLSYRRETQLTRGDVVLSRLMVEQSYYISIIETFKALFHDPKFAKLILEEVVLISPEGVYNSFTDGYFFQSHSLFSNYLKKTLRLQIFYDGMGTTNPLRGHCAPHNVGVFYFIIENLPTHYNSCFQNIHVFALCHTLDLKKNGFGPVLSRFMEDLQTLETEGVTISVPEVGDIQIHATISQFSGDCLAMNEIYGLVCDFSHDYNCAICYSTKEEFSNNFLDTHFSLRSKQQHAVDLLNVSYSNDSRVIHVRGVKHDSVLNGSLFFHTAESRSLDIMHVMSEGIIPYEFSCILHEFIVIRKVIDLDTFNEKVRQMYCILEVDKGNTPAELNKICDPGKGLSPKLTANEIFCLFRNSMYILGDYVDDDADKHWKLFLQLQSIVDIVFAPKLTTSMLNYYSELYEKHLKLFRKLYNHLPIKPKQHFMVHFPTIVRRNGPPTFNSCMKYELRNSFFKRTSHIICNFKNIVMSLATRNQITSLSHTLRKTRMRDNCVKTHKCKTIPLQHLNGWQIILERLHLDLDSTVTISVKAKIWGRRYSKGNIVVLGKRCGDRILEFGLVETIIWSPINELAYLFVKKMETLGLDQSINAYNVKQQTGDTFLILSINELYDYHPLDVYTPYDDREMYVRLKYSII